MFFPELKSKVDEDISILVKLDNHSASYLCECGDASLLSVKDCQQIEVVFISHTHIDHFINFDTLLRHQIGSEKRVTIIGPNGILAQTQSKIKGYSWNLIEEGAITYEIREIVNENLVRIYEINPPTWEIKQIRELTDNLIFENERFEVSFTILNHKIDSIAYLFKERDTINIDIAKSGFKGGAWVKELKQAYLNGEKALNIQIDNKVYVAADLFNLIVPKKGNTLGIIMDHAVNADNHIKIKSLFSKCDKVFIESFYKQDDFHAAQQNFHSYSTASGKIMKECGVKEAIPVHFSRKYNSIQMAELIEEFKVGFR